MDRAGALAGFGDLMTEMCAYYLVLGVLFLGERGWGVPLWVFLLGAALCRVFYGLLLRRDRGVPFLTAVTVILFAGAAAALTRISATPVYFGYGLALALGAGMAVGLALYHCLRRPAVLDHLTHLDGQVLILFALLLARERMAPAAGDVFLTAAVLLMDTAGAVGLRLSDGDGAGGGDVRRAALAALGAGLLLGVLILLLTAVFSRSGGVTAGILHAVGAGLAAIWDAVERFVFWLASFVTLRETYGAGELAPVASGEMSALENYRPKIPVNTTVIAVLLCLMVLAAAVGVARQLRRQRVAGGGLSPAAVRRGELRRERWLPRLWKELHRRAAFGRDAFRYRDTPAGLLVWLERQGRRRGTPRGAGESMRSYLGRMAPEGALTELAEALDREFYGGAGPGLPPERCRELRRERRRAYREERRQKELRRKRGGADVISPAAGRITNG